MLVSRLFLFVEAVVGNMTGRLLDMIGKSPLLTLKARVKFEY